MFIPIPAVSIWAAITNGEIALYSVSLLQSYKTWYSAVNVIFSFHDNLMSLIAPEGPGSISAVSPTSTDTNFSGKRNISSDSANSSHVSNRTNVCDSWWHCFMQILYFRKKKRCSRDRFWISVICNLSERLT